jgi:hypothetical protein
MQETAAAQAFLVMRCEITNLTISEGVKRLRCWDCSAGEVFRPLERTVSEDCELVTYRARVLRTRGRNI